MRLQCSCGFSGLFVGGGVTPTRCPVCRSGTLTVPAVTSNCAQCSLAYPVTSSSCPGCGVERISRQRSRETGKAPVPDGSPSS